MTDAVRTDKGRPSGMAEEDQPLSGMIRRRSRREQLRSVPWLIRFSMIMLVLFVLIAIFAPLVAPYDPTEQSLLDRLTGPSLFELDSGQYLLGTDELGRDMLSRVIYGTRISLGIAMIGMVIGLVIGTTMGVISGYRGGTTDNLVMFLVDVQQAVPFIIVALAALAIFGTDLKVLFVVVGLAGWDSFARFSRGMTLSAREAQYVLAARSQGASQARIILRHILPNVTAPLIVLATLNITAIILLESSLSFLGIGVQPPRPSWGSMIGEGRDYLNTAWWIAVVPGLAMIVVTMSVNTVGDWLRDVLDPTLKGGR